MFKKIKNERLKGNYSISDNGIVRNDTTGHILSIQTDKQGYKLIHLHTIEERHGSFLIHRLVAEASIPNPLGLPQLNHKDENKHNHSVHTLLRVTAKYNANYGNRNNKGLDTKNKKQCRGAEIPIWGYNGEERREFKSIAEAAKQIGASKSNVWMVLRHYNNCKTIKGWSFYEV